MAISETEMETTWDQTDNHSTMVNLEALSSTTTSSDLEPTMAKEITTTDNLEAIVQSDHQ
jgi:hypothetical protein